MHRGFDLPHGAAHLHGRIVTQQEKLDEIGSADIALVDRRAARGSDARRAASRNGDADADDAAGIRDTSRVVAGTYAVEPSHTQILFTVNHLGFTEYTGEFTNPTGMMTIDPANPANDKVEITVPIAKLQTTVTALDEHLNKPDFFDSAQFPTATFVSNKVTVHGMNATIAGNLTLKGVTRPVVLAARFIGAGTAPMGPKKLTVGFAATTSFNRSDFGIKFGVPMVSDKVDLVINAAFVGQ